jgi:competence protein ComEA
MACGHRSPDVTHTANIAAAEYAININTATLDELQRIPHVGEKVAARIVEHRQINGPFRRVEHLMLIQGISDKRFRKIRPLVRVE